MSSTSGSSPTSLLQIFLWKNSKSLLFRWKTTAFVFTTCLILLLFYAMKTDLTRIVDEVRYEPKDTYSLKYFLPGSEDDQICYSPDNEFTSSLIQEVKQDLSIIDERLCSFASKDMMLSYMETKRSTNSFAIHFEGHPGDGNWTKCLKYTISSTNTKNPTERIYLNDVEPVGIADFDEYIGSGFFILQQTIDRNFMKMQKGDPQFELEISPFPRIQMEEIDPTRLRVFSWLFLAFLNFILLTTMLVPYIEEKQDGVKEFLLLATSKSFYDEYTFYGTRFLICFLFTIVSLIIGHSFHIFDKISFCFTFMLYMFFVFSSMSYTMLLTTFFNSVFFAKIGGLIFYFVPFTILTVGGQFFEKLKFLLGSSIFFEGVYTFETFITKNRPVDISGLNINLTESCYKLVWVYFFLIWQSVFYLMFYYYISYVFPTNGMIKRPFYFIFQPSCLFQRKKYDVNIEISRSTESLNPESAVKIRNLTKEFKTGYGMKKIAVDNLNMSIEANKITALLGHNGAGKTTTINMIIGLLPKTSGDVIVDGIKDIDEYRHLIGYCPQHNIYMQYMTCMEHLEFFARLRGFDPAQAKDSANNLLHQLRLTDKAHEKGINLSGGMKRRLSLGIAISGNTKIIILDEPSSGLDPESRRELWNVLLDLRKQHAILVTTHYMEEAEVLGDTVSIMAKGRLACSNSPLELKRLYGSGYVLKLLIDGKADFNNIFDIIKQKIPSATVESIVPPTYCVRLPYEYQHAYSECLRKLEDKSSVLGILTMTISNTTLEDVFLNCNKDDETDSMVGKMFKNEIEYEPLKPTDKNSKITSGHQISAVIYKKIVFMKREFAYLLLMLLIPFIAVLIAVFAINSDPNGKNVIKPLPLNINQVKNSSILLKIPLFTSSFDGIKKLLIEEIQQQNVHPQDITDPHLSVEDALLQRQKEDLYDFNEHVMGAVELYINNDQPTLRVYYSGNFLHSSICMLNLVDNVLFKIKAGEEANIITESYPISRPTKVTAAKLEYFSSIVPVGFFIYMLFYITLPFKEKKNEFKILQPTSQITYWITFTMFDFVFHTIVCLLVLGLQILVDTEEIFRIEEHHLMGTSYIFYGFAYLPIMYIFASSFKTMSGLSSCIFMLFISSTIVPIITSGSVQAMQEYEAVIALMSFLPDFGLKHQLRVVHENYFISRRASSNGYQINNYRKVILDDSESLNTTYYYLQMICVGLIAQVLLVFIWENVNRRESILECLSSKCCETIKKRTPTEPLTICNEDVELEINNVDKIESAAIPDYSLLVKNLQKRYKNVHAVRGLSFAVKPGECFGLLGLNGAGKTTTFQMITGNKKLSNGEVYIKGISLEKDRKLFRMSYGYCPQSHAINEFMTSYEILKYMALIRGIPKQKIHQEVIKWIKLMDLDKYRDIPSRQYSGGTKRKLSAAIAMIGDPPIIFLDEPTTGVDPKSRRFMWACIQKFQKENKTIILTSHSMDECEYLCNRLAIMAHGQFQCIGYIPTLKNKLGCGYTLTLKVVEDSADIERFMFEISRQFTCVLREQHAGVLTYFVREKPIVWSTVFERIEKISALYTVVLQGYSINEITLEDIFLKFEDKLPIEEENNESSLV